LLASRACRRGEGALTASPGRPAPPRDGPSLKKSVGAYQRDEEARGAWRTLLESVDPERLVFVDECSKNIALVPQYARVPKSEKAFGKAPSNWRRNVMAFL
jgi:hypothetical protein